MCIIISFRVSCCKLHVVSNILFTFFIFWGAHVRAVSLPSSPASTRVCTCCSICSTFCLSSAFSLIFKLCLQIHLIWFDLIWFDTLVVQIKQSVVCVCVNNFWTEVRYWLTRWFFLTLCRSSSKVKVTGQSSLPQNEQEPGNCWNGRSWRGAKPSSYHGRLKSRTEFKIVNK